MYYDINEFPRLKILELNSEIIRKEYQALDSNNFTDWPEKELCDGKWTTFAFKFNGSILKDNVKLCPNTFIIIESIGNIVNAGFSILHPKSKILPHTGYTDQVLRCHLGINIPKHCYIEVDGIQKTWKKDKCLIFDDTVIHKAWNDSNEIRSLLLLDFKRD